MQKNIVLLFLLFLVSAVAADVACATVRQSAAMAAGDTIAVTQVAVFAPGTCQCSFLAAPDANITCCTDERWTPVVTLPVGACQCTFTAHQTIPANTFDFYACSTQLE